MENKQTMTETTFKGFKWFAEQGGDPVLALENELLNNQSMTETQTILKASDLRIGNWLLHNGKPFEVIDIGMYVDADTNYDGWLIGAVRIEELQPIVLSPEILEKAGLSNMESFLGVYRIKIDEMLIDIPMGKNKAAPHAKYKYVHQLQNLYHSLTGTELEIEL